MVYKLFIRLHLIYLIEVLLYASYKITKNKCGEVETFKCEIWVAAAARRDFQQSIRQG